MDIRFFDSLDSTNNYCKLLDPNSVGEFTVIWAGNQTAGIGQQGNVWVSEPHKNLTFSLILKPSFLTLADQWLLSMTLALAVSDFVAEQLSTVIPHCNHLRPADVNPQCNHLRPADVIHHCNHLRPADVNSQLSSTIKWPNDIYIGDRKVCGILVSNNVSGGLISNSICGIGLNVNQTLFPDWVPNPTSLTIETGNLYELQPLLEQLLIKIESRYKQLKSDPSSLKPDYMSRLYRHNEPSAFIYKGETISATITDIDRLGHLHLVTNSNEEISCNLKEIKFIL